jgi:hypothetical protein
MKNLAVLTLALFLGAIVSGVSGQAAASPIASAAITAVPAEAVKTGVTPVYCGYYGGCYRPCYGGCGYGRCYYGGRGYYGGCGCRRYYGGCGYGYGGAGYGGCGYGYGWRPAYYGYGWDGGMGWGVW